VIWVDPIASLVILILIFGFVVEWWIDRRR
jgi:hypothetical protein